MGGGQDTHSYISASNTTDRTRHPLSQKFHDLLKEMGEIRDRKGEDYGRDNDPYYNVRRGEGWGVKPWVNAMVRASDKMVRLEQMADRGSLSNEAARDSFLDLAVYALIGLILFEEEQEK